MLRNCLVTYRPAASFAASACVGPVLHFQRSQAGVIQEAPRRTRNLGEMLLQLESLGRSIRRIRTHVLAIQKRCVNGIDDHPSNLLLCILSVLFRRPCSRQPYEQLSVFLPRKSYAHCAPSEVRQLAQSPSRSVPSESRCIRKPGSRSPKALKPPSPKIMSWCADGEARSSS